MTDKDTYTTGTVATAATVPVLLIALAIIGIAAWLMIPRAKTRADRVGLRRIAAGAAGTLVVVAAATWWGMYPWRAEYHEWRPMTGVIDDITPSAGVVGGLGGYEYVVRLVGDHRDYDVTDTRMADAHAGDQFTAVCVRRYQWTGPHPYECRLVTLRTR